MDKYIKKEGYSMEFYKGIIKKILIVLLILAVLLVPLFMYFNFLNSPPRTSSQSKDIRIRIKTGMSSDNIIDKLFENGLINNKLFAKIYMKSNAIGKNLKAGTYKFNLNMNPIKIFTMIKNHQIDLNFVNFTIPEGFNAKQIAQKLYSAGLISDTKDFLNEAQNGKFNYSFLRKSFSDRKSRLEGYLFPDTYNFEKGMTSHYMIDAMLKRFELVYSGVKSDININSESLDKIIIIASIIEGEAKLNSEREIISAVLYNRLKKNMRLQIDATVQYALGEHRSVLYFKDLAVNSPYNTYKYNGLPIGPICSPGKKSILAALNPAKVKYIYYVAKGDGSHYFTIGYKDFLKYKKLLKSQ